LAVDPDALAREVRFLRKGRAARHPSLMLRLGPQVRGLCGIVDSDSVTRARAKLRAKVRALLRDEDDAVELAVSVALALHAEADQRTLAGRQLWLARHEHYEHRTARRRMDEAFRVLVRAAVRAENDS
jgi:hypothetical protein